MGRGSIVSYREDLADRSGEASCYDMVTASGYYRAVLRPLEQRVIRRNWNSPNAVFCPVS